MAFYDVDNAMTVKLDYDLPPYPTFREGIRRAPRREAHLSEADKALAIRNAIRQAIGAVEADVAGTLAANIDHMVVPKEYQHAE